MLQGSFLLIKIQALYWPGKLKKKEHFLLLILLMDYNIFLNYELERETGGSQEPVIAHLDQNCFQ